MPHHVEGARRTTPHGVLVQRSLRDRIARGRVKGVAWRCFEHEDDRHRSLVRLGRLASTRDVGVGRQSRSAEEEQARLPRTRWVWVTGDREMMHRGSSAAMAMGRRPKAIPPGFSSCIISDHP